MNNASSPSSEEEEPRNTSPPSFEVELQEGPITRPPSPPSSTILRQRKKTNSRRRQLSYQVVNNIHINNDDNSNSIDERPHDNNLLNQTQETVFLNMYLRKMQRRVNGQYSNDSLCCEFIVVVILSIFIISIGWEHEMEQGAEMTNADTIGAVVVLVWIAICCLVFFIMANASPYVRMLRYMVIYIPLLFFLASVSFYSEAQAESLPPIPFLKVPQQYWILVLAIVLEVVTFASFMLNYKLGPRVLQSDWVRNTPGRVRKMWSIESMVVNDAWTMRYRGHNPTTSKVGGCSVKCQLDYTCKYVGDVDEDGSGLPDGMGRWIDDAWEGEMLTGYWKQGSPVAPFSSWNVGNDDAVVAVRVAYFKATDDAFSKNKFYPTNDQCPPECGVASVECSVSGSFYKHLPCATVIEGPYVTDSMPTQQHNPLREVLSHLFHGGEVEGGDSSDSVHIRAAGARGVQVLGHVYGPTGRYFSRDAKSITVDVEWGNSKGGGGSDINDQTTLGELQTKRHSSRFVQKSLFMPRASSNLMSRIVEIEVDDSSEEENIDDDPEAQDHHVTNITDQSSDETKSTANLHVQNWIPCRYKEALIFCPGYNSCMENSLKNMGQFLAMTKLSQHVYPIVFVWPGSKNVGYPYASKISATDINQRNMLRLVRGLKEAGVHRVHFLSHSMGVQTLMGAFRDKYDDDGRMIGRSDVSKEFTLDPDFDTSKGPKEGKRQQYSDRMTCKSITLLNPDFPVRAFVDRGFLTIRRVCQTITVVGDRNDRALGWSSFINAVAPRFGYKEPRVLWPTISSDNKLAKWELVKRIGRSVEDLYFPPKVARQYRDDENDEAFRRLLFNKLGSLDLSGRTKNGTANIENRLWLDMDVIDMTGLDTNIKGMRHSGFSLNGMLLKDLQELFSTGERAMKRSTLLFREGNQFSFVRAPAFVSQ